MAENEHSDKKSVRSPKASVGLWIVWRFKDNKGWQKGYIKEALAGGKVIRITDTDYSSEHNGSTVAVADIDWYRQ